MSRAEVLDRLFDVIAQRGREKPKGSYVVQLLEGGLAGITGKVREESAELIEAAEAEDSAQTAHEVADLIFHTWVLMAAVGVTPEQVYTVLEERFGVGGLIEKARRGEGDAHGG